MHHLSKLFIFINLFALSASALANTKDDDRGKMIPLQQCRLSPSFYCLNVTGSAIKAPTGMDAIPIRFDTGGNTLVLPMGCIDMSKVKVLNANDVNHLRGTQSELVEGQIALRSADGQTLYHLDHYKFYAVTGQKDCQRSLTGGNFGAGPLLATDPQTHTFVSSFFNQYPYPAGITPGFTLIPVNPQAKKIGQDALLKIGADPIPTDMFSIPLRTTTAKNQHCAQINGGDTNLCRGFTDTTGFNFGYIIPHSKITVKGGAEAGSPSIVIPAANSLVDSGGGITLIDDTDDTLISSLRGALLPPPRFLPWLDTCSVLKTGAQFTYQAVDEQGHTIHYQFPVTAPSRGEQKFSVAVCHKRKEGHWLEHGINVGYGFFSHAHKLIFRLDPEQGGAFGVQMPDNNDSNA